MTRTLALLDGDVILGLPEAGDGYFTEIACHSNEVVRWRALPPDGPDDVWVGVSLEQGVVTANSWSGWRLEFDPQTGNEQSRRFTK